ncbi:ribonuclease H2, subunit B [Tricharina praecox]|uniref:ribonuclease H2, subunit B n=1 Tax=Tricharina praecox TaxID=43433 RepID=UPI00221FFC9C|nr:ribonuclease H2, subunit B [Tricharina praecox]KAI5858574.1 ribonuclease H2, subunit B [Tricharina praecox]
MPPPPTLIAILPTPSSTSPTKILTLPHPRTSTPTRYLLHPSAGLHELTKITPPSSQPRSWLLTHPSPGYTLSDGSLYISTPLDPLFLLLPHLLAKADEKHFLPLDDLLDELPAVWAAVLAAQRNVVERRVRAVCAAIDAGGEKAYRLCLEKTRRVLARKCQAMAQALPRSLEEEFVRRPLVKPVTAASVVVLEARSGEEEETTAAEKESDEKKEGDMEDTPKEEPDAAMTHLLRLRVSAQFLGSTYLPTSLATALTEHLASVHDFAILDEHLAHLKQLRLDSAAARSGDFSLKRGNDDEASDAKAEKKRKTEEDEAKKKKNVSRGVRELGKVNTRGMAKLTSFFKKKE